MGVLNITLCYIVLESELVPSEEFVLIFGSGFCYLYG